MLSERLVVPRVGRYHHWHRTSWAWLPGVHPPDQGIPVLPGCAATAGREPAARCQEISLAWFSQHSHHWSRIGSQKCESQVVASPLTFTLALVKIVLATMLSHGFASVADEHRALVFLFFQTCLWHLEITAHLFWPPFRVPLKWIFAVRRIEICNATTTLTIFDIFTQKLPMVCAESMFFTHCATLHSDGHHQLWWRAACFGVCYRGTLWVHSTCSVSDKKQEEEVVDREVHMWWMTCWQVSCCWQWVHCHALATFVAHTPAVKQMWPWFKQT